MSFEQLFKLRVPIMQYNELKRCFKNKHEANIRLFLSGKRNVSKC